MVVKISMILKNSIMGMSVCGCGCFCGFGLFGFDWGWLGDFDVYFVDVCV